MSDKGELVSQVLLTAKTVGLSDITPIVLNDGGNLIIHLAPHPIVARVATVTPGEDAERAYKILARELRVAHHLHNKGIPVLLPIDKNENDVGPHYVDGTWMTFWRYVPLTQLQPLSPKQAVELVSGLSIAMKDLPDALPVLGVWDRVCRSAARLGKHSDHRIQSLLKVFLSVDQQMQEIDPGLLIPSHGDAHARNLLPSPEGWLWMDFEDVSLMPAYWDLASFVGNLILFRGFQEPTFRYILDHTDIVAEPKAFGLAISARTLMSTLGNLDLALEGHSNLAFATRQLELAEDFLCQIDLYIN